jgi:dihydropteroate synthase
MELLKYFKQRISDAEQAGISDVILDPGFGFSKTLEQNYEVLNHLGVLRIFDKPILAGISRKSMIYKVIGGGPQKALNGTTALHIIALQKGAKILRVHDVKEAKEVLKLAEYLNTEKN